MKNILYALLFTISLTSVFSSCSKNDTTPLFAIVTPDTTAVLKTGQKQTYTIQMFPRDGQKVNSMSIISVDKDNAEITLLDTTFAATPNYVKYVFNAHAKYNGEITLRFIINDVLGNTCVINRSVNVVNDAVLENEITPAPVLCTDIDADNAFDLKEKKTFAFVPGSGTYVADLYIEKDSEGNFKLRSDSKLSFARTNSTRDFYDATILSLNDTYQKLTASESITGLTGNDVIIYASEENVKGVIIIKSVDDVNNKVTLGIKSISSK